MEVGMGSLTRRCWKRLEGLANCTVGEPRVERRHAVVVRGLWNPASQPAGPAMQAVQAGALP
eukprot:9829721-Alexandrium_andersonii.AAC.1